MEVFILGMMIAGPGEEGEGLRPAGRSQKDRDLYCTGSLLYKERERVAAAAATRVDASLLPICLPWGLGFLVSFLPSCFKSSPEYTHSLVRSLVLLVVV